jgi:hypothetical protein
MHIITYRYAQKFSAYIPLQLPKAIIKRGYLTIDEKTEDKETAKIRRDKRGINFSYNNVSF